MSRKSLIVSTAIVGAALVAAGGRVGFSQDFGQVGRDLQQGVQSIGQGVREGWTEIKNKADQMGVEARVYARLHWDKALESATLDISVQKEGVVLLKGSVTDAQAKATAVRLAQDTIDVSKVIDQLAVAPTATVAPAPR